MSIWGHDSHLYCKVFSSSLGTVALQWFCSLTEGSIRNWRELQTSFLDKFRAYRVMPRTDVDLMALRMKPEENITKFAKRFWAIYSRIENSKEGVVIFAFQNALRPGNDLRKDLARCPPATIPALMSRVTQFVAQEEDEDRGRESHGIPAYDIPRQGERKYESCGNRSRDSQRHEDGRESRERTKRNSPSRERKDEKP